jgi:hypothetical protein
MDNGIICIFEHKKFNDTQKVTLMGESHEADVSALARHMREMDEWLVKSHSDKIF